MFMVCCAREKDGLTLEDEGGGDDTDTETDSGLDNDV